MPTRGIEPQNIGAEPNFSPCLEEARSSMPGRDSMRYRLRLFIDALVHLDRITRAARPVCRGGVEPVCGYVDHLGFVERFVPVDLGDTPFFSASVVARRARKRFRSKSSCTRMPSRATLSTEHLLTTTTSTRLPSSCSGADPPLHRPTSDAHPDLPRCALALKRREEVDPGRTVGFAQRNGVDSTSVFRLARPWTWSSRK